jgi:ElaB/YqjD/DUF883 family membrane-anchored ribosome-binding protein
MGEGPKDVTREGEPSPDMASIRAEIQQKRADISETLDEIQERLTPKHLVSKATGTVRNATTNRVRQFRGAASDAVTSTRRVASRTAEQAREHPWSAAAVVAGAGAAAWWFATQPSRAQEEGSQLDQYTEESLYFDEDLTFANGNGGLTGLLKTGTVPVVLTGVAVGWWLWRRQSASGATVPPADLEDDTSWNGGAYGSAGADAASYRTFEGDRRWKDEPLTGAHTSRIRETLSDAASRAREVAAAAGQRTREVAGQAQRQLTDRSRRAASQLDQWLDENPLAAGATALLLGLAIGLAIPETDRERRFLGGARQRLIQRAQQAGRDAVGRARQTLVEATNQARRA